MTSEEQTTDSYWSSVLVSGAGVGIIVFILSIIASYVQINSEPTGSMWGGLSVYAMLPCLLGALGGILAVWHYTKEVNNKMKLGRGAVIGLWVGVVIIVVSMILNKAWMLVDPDLTKAMQDHMIANFEMSSLPDAQKQVMIDRLYQDFQSQNTLWGIAKGLLGGSLLYGIINMVTGMIGVKIFAEEPEATL